MFTLNELVLLNYEKTVIICIISFAQMISRSLKTSPTCKPVSFSQLVASQLVTVHTS